MSATPSDDLTTDSTRHAINNSPRLYIDIGGHTTYFSFFGFRPGFFGTKSRPMADIGGHTTYLS